MGRSLDPPHNMKVTLLGSQTGEVGFTALLWRSYDGTNERGLFVSDMDQDNDGPGGSTEEDPDWNPETSLKHNGESINSHEVSGIVVPTWLPMRVHGTVLGCQAFATNLATGKREPAVVYDLGPTRKSGEGSNLLCKRLGADGGENRPLFLFEFFPGIPAQVDGITYDLQPISQLNA